MHQFQEKTTIDEILHAALDTRNQLGTENLSLTLNICLSLPGAQVEPSWHFQGHPICSVVPSKKKKKSTEKGFTLDLNILHTFCLSSSE